MVQIKTFGTVSYDTENDQIVVKGFELDKEDIPSYDTTLIRLIIRALEETLPEDPPTLAEIRGAQNMSARDLTKFLAEQHMLIMNVVTDTLDNLQNKE